MYEVFLALTSVLPQHFVYYFSGKDIASIWTKFNIVGTNTFAIQDAAGEGLRITLDGGVASHAAIYLNNKRQFIHNSSVIIGIVKTANLTGSTQQFGFSDTANILSVTNEATCGMDGIGALINLTTKDGTTESATNSDQNTNANLIGIKIECGASDVKLYLNGVLKITKTTNPPSAKMQPFMSTRSSNANTGDILSVEAYNTPQNSLYEKLTPITTIQKLRHRTDFVGKGLDTNVWRANIIVGTGTFQIVDGSDEGLSGTTSGAANDRQVLDFADKRQFSHNSSEIISVSRRVTASTSVILCGLTKDQTGAEEAYVADFAADTFKKLTTAGASVQSITNTDVAVDTVFHKYKIVLSASDCKLYIDGVLKVTKTTNLPTSAMQPVLYVQTTAASVGEARWKFFEAKHTETGLFDFIDSLFNLGTAISKLHFVEWFIGNDINTNIWRKNSAVGTPTFQMSDVADEGDEIITSAATGDRGELDFQNKRQFSHSASTIIWVYRILSTALNKHLVGMMDDTRAAHANASCVEYDSAVSANFFLYTIGTGSSSTDSGIAADTSFHSFKIVNGSSDVKLFIDGILRVTKTTNLPTAKMMPHVDIITLTTAAKTIRLKYCEVRNT